MDHLLETHFWKDPDGVVHRIRNLFAVKATHHLYGAFVLSHVGECRTVCGITLSFDAYRHTQKPVTCLDCLDDVHRSFRSIEEVWGVDHVERI